MRWLFSDQLLPILAGITITVSMISGIREARKLPSPARWLLMAAFVGGGLFFLWALYLRDFLPADMRWLRHLLIWPTFILAGLAYYADHLHKRRARRRAQTGHCPTCGYSLRGLDAEPLCPECAAPKDVRTVARRWTPPPPDH